MNGQQETTANAPKEQKLCRMGCGFFGSNATGDCCSKCWNESRNKAVAAAPAPVAQPTATPAPAPIAVPIVATTSPVAEPAPSPVAEIKPAAMASPTKKKKKKKKMGYKNMLAGMMEGSGERDAQKDKESIQRVTGGGAFVKIDRI